MATLADGGGTYLCWCLIRVSKHAPRWVFISLMAFFCCCRIISYRKPLSMLFLYICVLVQCERELLRSAPRSQEPNLTRLCSLWRKQAVQKAEGIIRQYDGVLSDKFTVAPSGRRFSAPVQQTNHYANLFLPSAIRLLNAE